MRFWLLLSVLLVWESSVLLLQGRVAHALTTTTTTTTTTTINSKKSSQSSSPCATKLSISLAPPPSSSSSEQQNGGNDIAERDNKLQQNSNFWIPLEELQPPKWVTTTTATTKEDTTKDKVINLFGVWCAIVSLVTCPFWMLAMALIDLHGHGEFKDSNDNDGDPNRALFDQTGKVWCKVWLSLTDSYPTQSGNLYRDGPCLYVANHASWLDIALVCIALENVPVFKFIAKQELTKLPGIGQQLVGGKHILIERDDRRSQLKTFKEAMAWLQKRRVPLMAFPEGTRSKDTGRLSNQEFKGGLFSMAIKTGVPIVPLTLSHTHAVFPSYAWLPVQPGRGKLHVHAHDPIDSTGRTDRELAELVRQAFVSALPDCQQPLLKEEKETTTTNGEEIIKLATVEHVHITNKQNSK